MRSSLWSADHTIFSRQPLNGFDIVDDETVDITPGPATGLAFTVQPVDGAIGTVMPLITVSALDSFGNLATAFTDSIGLSITGGTGNVTATLSGMLAVAPLNGEATFADLSIDSAGTNFTLDAGAPGLPTITSDPFKMVDINRISVILNDTLVVELVSDLTAPQRLPMEATLTQCDTGIGQADPATVAACLSAARGQVGTAADPTDTVLLAVLDRFFDLAERLLAP